MSLLNVGARALLANQLALHTTGHNIANESVVGYSRQSAVMETVVGQHTRSGHVGNGVTIATILRNHSELLTRQAAQAQAMQAGDAVRAMRLTQMQDVFGGGSNGVGAAIDGIMQALGDVVTTPTDLAPRTVALARMDEMAARMRTAAEGLQNIGQATREQMQSHAEQINHLAHSIAQANAAIAQAQSRDTRPNDLLDKRDQLIRELNQYVQTTQVPADDGSVGVFMGNSSHALVLGSTAATLSVGDCGLFPGSRQMAMYLQRPGQPPLELNEGVSNGGEIAALLRFANHDLVAARNGLGRMAQAIAMRMNAQQQCGLTLDGATGKALFSVPDKVAGSSRGQADATLHFTDAARFVASDYEVRFSAPGAGQVVRLSDGKSTAFSSLDDPALQNIDGLAFELASTGTTGERIRFSPFAHAAEQLQMLIYSPRDLAAANPINAALSASNTGTLQLAALQVTDSDFTAPPIPSGVTLHFHPGPPSTCTLSGSTSPVSGTTVEWTPGTALHIDGWAITLQGTPKEGDSVTVGNALDPQYGDIYTRDSGNAAALQGLENAKLFDGAAMTDGWANLMAQTGSQVQSALYAARLSESIANHLEADRTAVSGVNLDEEAARLIQYQQAYQASAKMLQIAQSIFDNLISSISR